MDPNAMYEALRNRQEELAKQAQAALDIFGPLLKCDEARCTKERRERWTKLKGAVAKDDSAGFRIIKERFRKDGWMKRTCQMWHSCARRPLNCKSCGLDSRRGGASSYYGK